MKERIMCKTHCIVWNDIDKDCEIYGEHHPCPRRCPYYQKHTAFEHVEEIDRMRDTLTEKEKQIERLQERNEKLEKMAFHYTPEEWNTMMRMVARLKEQLAIATKALEGVCVWANTGNGGEYAVKKVCEQALKKMRGVR